MSLNPKQRRFVIEYLKDQNGTQAAIRSGYSKRSARQIADRLMSKDVIRDAVEAQLSDVAKRVGVTVEHVLGSLKEVGERCMQRVPVMIRDPRDGRRMIQKEDLDTGEGVWEFDSMGANKSLELQGKHLKLFTDKVEVTDLTDFAKILRERREKRKRTT